MNIGSLRLWTILYYCYAAFSLSNFVSWVYLWVLRYHIWSYKVQISVWLYLLPSSAPSPNPNLGAEVVLFPDYPTRWPRNFRLYTVPKFKVRNVPNFKVRNVPNFKVRNIPNLKVVNITIYNSGQSFTSFRLLKPTIKHD